MNCDTLLKELENKNEEICQFLKRALTQSNFDNVTFELLAKKLQNHDKLLINALIETNNRLEKITTTLAKHIN